MNWWWRRLARKFPLAPGQVAARGISPRRRCQASLVCAGLRENSPGAPEQVAARRVSLRRRSDAGVCTGCGAIAGSPPERIRAQPHVRRKAVFRARRWRTGTGARSTPERIRCAAPFQAPVPDFAQGGATVAASRARRRRVENRRHRRHGAPAHRFMPGMPVKRRICSRKRCCASTRPELGSRTTSSLVPRPSRTSL